MLLAPGQRVPRGWVQFVDAKRRPVHRPGGGVGGHRDRRDVDWGAQDAKGGNAQGAWLEAGAVERRHGFWLGLIEHRQEEMLWSGGLASVGGELLGRLLGLCEEVAGPAPAAG